MTENFHIAVVVASMRTGGAERAMLNLANGFQKRGIETDLVLIEKTGEFLSHVNKGVNICDLKKRHSRQGIFSFRKYLKKNSPDVIIVAQTHIQMMAITAAKLSGWKGKIILNEQSTFSSNTKKGFFGFLASVLFRSADAVSVVSQGSADDMVKKFSFLKNKTSVIYNPVFSEEILQLKNENVDHPFLDKRYPLILSAGRLTASKNYKLLLDAFSIILKTVESRLIIIGDGEERIALESHAKKLGVSSAVSFPGNRNNPYAFMSRCDVFVMTSLYEGLPSVLIEALACGCKIVSSDCPHGPREILEDGKYGSLVPPGNAALLAEEIIKAMRTENDKSAQLDRARDFGIEKITDEYLELIRKINQLD